MNISWTSSKDFCNKKMKSQRFLTLLDQNLKPRNPKIEQVRAIQWQIRGQNQALDIRT